MATYEMSQVQSRIILVVMTIICVGVFITMPVEKLSCDRSKNACVVSTSTLLGGGEKVTYPLNEISGVSVEHEKYQKRLSREGHSRRYRYQNQYRSKLFLNVSGKNVQIFSTHDSSSSTYFDNERNKISRYLSSKDNNLDVSINKLFIRLILIIFIVAFGYGAFKVQ